MDFMVNERGDSQLISYALVIGIGILVIGIVYTLGWPAVDQMNAQQNFEQAKTNLQKLDAILQQLAQTENAGQIIAMDLGTSKMDVNADNDQIRLEVKTKTGFLAEDQVFIERPIRFIQTGNTIRLWLDYNNTAIDLNESFSSSNGFKQLAIQNIGYQNARAKIQIKER